MRASPLIRLLGAALLAIGVAAVPTVAHAHTDFDYSLPTDGAAVAVPLEEITVGFTKPVTLIGPGFRVLTPQGDELTPLVVTDDDMVFRIQLDPPLAGGVVAVTWEVAAEDGHPLSGAFTFTVDVDPSSVSTIAPATTTPVTSAMPVVTEPETVVTAAPQTTVPEAVPSTSMGGMAMTGEHTSSGSGGGSTGSDHTDLYVAIAAAIALGAGAFVMLRPSPIA